MAITISGENNNDRILASDGVIDSLSGFNVVGVITATSFTGDLTGNLTGNVTGNINNSTLLLQTGGTERVRIDSNGVLSMRSGSTPLSGTSHPYTVNIYRDGGSGYGYFDTMTNSSYSTGVRIRTYNNTTYNNVIEHTTSKVTNFQTNGSTRLSINSNGLVEIKNFSGRGLHLQGAGDPTIRVEDTDGTNQYGEFANNGGHSYIVTRNNTNHGTFTLYSQNGSETLTRLHITSDGKFGVGTANIDERIHFENAGNITVLAECNTTGSGANAAYRLKSADSSSDWYIQTGNVTNGGLRFYSGSERLRIDSSGRLIVGGGTDPAESTIVAKGNSTSATSYSVLDMRRGEAADSVGDVLGYIRFSDTNIPSSNNNYALIYAAVDAASSGQGDNPGRLVFSTTADGASGPTERLRIDSSGHVTVKSSSAQQAPELRIESYGEYGRIRADGNGSIIIDADPDFNSNNSYIGFSVDGSMKSTINADGALGIGNLQTAQSTSTTHTSKTKFYIDSTKFTKVARLAAGNISSAGWFTVAKIASSNGNYFKCYASIGGDFTQDMCIIELTGAFSASGALGNNYAEPVFTAHRVGAHSTDRITRARFVKDSSNLTYLQIYIASGHSSYWGKSVLEYTMGAYAQNIADSGSAAMFEAQASGLIGIRTLEVDDNALCTNAGSHKFYSGGGPTERLRILSSGELRIISSGNNNDPAHLRLHCNDTSISTNDGIGQIRFAGRDSGGTDVSRTGALIQATAAAAWDTGQSSGYSATHLDFFTQSNSGTNNISAGPRLRITGSGNVVIGHTDANAKLQVNSGTSSAVGDATNPAFQIGSTSNYRFAIHTTNEQAIIANKNGDDGISFHTKSANGGSFGEALRITSNGHVTPGSNNTQDLGSTAKGWRNTYTNDLNLSNMNGEINDIDGTQGSWTIQEGKDDLYIINRLNGKKFKIKMEEVS